jgi:glycosyltransferase involved in cell wall biosynthesis
MAELARVDIIQLTPTWLIFGICSSWRGSHLQASAQGQGYVLLSDNFSVIVSHPARQAIVYHRPRGAEQMGINVTLLTGLYYKPNSFPYFLTRWLPARRRTAVTELLELRRMEGLSPDNVTTLFGPALECAYKAGVLSLRTWWAIWDWLAARWIQFRRTSNRTVLIHCFIECSLRTLRAARSKRMTRILEVTLPPLLADQAQMSKWGVSDSDFPNDIPGLKKELAEADFVLVQSEFGVRTIEALGFPASRILRIHLGLDTEEFRPRAGTRLPGRLRVIFVGQLNRRKGVHHLLQAWKELNPDGAELLLAGNTHSAPPELLASIAGTPNCRAFGHLKKKELVSFYQQADLLVHPSLAEGGCAAIYEALGCGLPCIVSSNSTSAVRSGIEGLVFPTGDVTALKTAMRELLTDATRRQTMSISARERAERSLSLAAFSREIAEIYRGVAERSDKCGRAGASESRLVTAF